MRTKPQTSSLSIAQERFPGRTAWPRRALCARSGPRPFDARPLAVQRRLERRPAPTRRPPNEATGTERQTRIAGVTARTRRTLTSTGAPRISSAAAIASARSACSPPRVNSTRETPTSASPPRGSSPRTSTAEAPTSRSTTLWQSRRRAPSTSRTTPSSPTFARRWRRGAGVRAPRLAPGSSSPGASTSTRHTRRRTTRGRCSSDRKADSRKREGSSANADARTRAARRRRRPGRCSRWTTGTSRRHGSSSRMRWTRTGRTRPAGRRGPTWNEGWATQGRRSGCSGKGRRRHGTPRGG